MEYVEFERIIAFPAQRVWAVLEDFGNTAWAVGVSRTEIIGEGIGMTRRLYMEGMEPIDEVLKSIDPQQMTFSYSIPRGLPLPITDYTATARLEALGDTSTRVKWSCECIPEDPGLSYAELEQMIHATYTLLVDLVSSHLTRIAPGGE
jgi:hypothetical protein